MIDINCKLCNNFCKQKCFFSDNSKSILEAKEKLKKALDKAYIHYKNGFPINAKYIFIDGIRFEIDMLNNILKK